MINSIKDGNTGNDSSVMGNNAEHTDINDLSPLPPSSSEGG